MNFARPTLSETRSYSKKYYLVKANVDVTAINKQHFENYKKLKGIKLITTVEELEQERHLVKCK
ncbi:MAG: hypothetical protein IPL26_30255 [Leptospiraceae bacterium]|nr:hypothetical protein [Leptospiraceae bacterium]